MRLSDMIPRARILLAALVASGLVLCGCSNPESTPSESASQPLPTASIDAAADLSGITVSDTDVPEVTVPAPWGIAATQTTVLREGTGPQTVGGDATIKANYHGVNGRTGEVFDSSYLPKGEREAAPVDFSLAGNQVIKGFKAGLVGQKVGSRVLIGVTPADGYPSGTRDGSIQAGDSLLFVVDIISASTYDQPFGETITPAEGLPTVTVADGKPELTIPEGYTSDSLVVQQLIKGEETAVAADSTVSVKYRGWGLNSGKLIYDAWQSQSGNMASFIEGWKTGLVGQPLGSRVMLVVPAAQAFPNGDPEHGLEAGEGVVYVIDILGVQAPPS